MIHIELISGFSDRFSQAVGDSILDAIRRKSRTIVKDTSASVIANTAVDNAIIECKKRSPKDNPARIIKVFCTDTAEFSTVEEVLRDLRISADVYFIEAAEFARIRAF